MSKPFLGEFCHTYNLERILVKFTSHESPKNPSNIDLLLTNKQERFLKVELSSSFFKISFKKIKFDIVS